MKTYSHFLISAIFLGTPFFCVSAETFKINPSSRVEFSVRNFLVTRVQGTFKVKSGEIQIDPVFIKSKANVTIDANSINTENEKRDSHLRTPDFFDTKKFSEIKFESKEIKGNEQEFILIGPLTMHGQSQDVSLQVKATGASATQRTYEASTEIDRNQFGITGGSSIGDKVKITLQIIANP